MAPDPMREYGFTLVEMIVVIALTAIIAAAVAVFIKLPVQGYTDAARRAEMTDVADTALRRIGRDLRLALPNSVRVTDGGATVELILTTTGGRYRVESDPTNTAIPLDFASAATQFDQLGTLTGVTANSDSMVVYNLGITGADAYAGDNRALITGTPTGALANEQRIQINAKQFPLGSPGNRFQVVSGPVSYVCDTATGRLTRYWGYGYQTTQPTAAQLAALGGTNARLADGVSNCAFDYTAGITARAGLVTLVLQLTQSGESVRLYHEVHVSNVP